MGGSIQNHGHELSLNCSESSLRTSTRFSIPCTINDFLLQVSMINNVSDKSRKLDDYIKRLQGELRKIDAFKPDLPLCFFLLHDAIEVIKEEIVKCRKLIGEPVLEEFIPLKKICDGEGEVEDNNEGCREESKDIEEKMNWLSSAQLGSCVTEFNSANLNFKTNKQSVKPNIPKRSDGEVNHAVSNDPMKCYKNQFPGHAFVPFERYTSLPLVATRNEEEILSGVPGLSLETPGMTNRGDDILASYFSSKTGPCRTGSSSTSNGQCSTGSRSRSQQLEANRKQRRCWSPELHRQFVDALQQLGGSQVATPKQIRELMHVDDLTNDEVKSHLQKYRLHTRRNSVTSASTPNQSDALGNLILGLDKSGEPLLKQKDSESGSPNGPLHYDGTSRGTSMTGGDIMEDEDEEKSESHSWKGHVHSLEKNTI